MSIPFITYLLYISLPFDFKLSPVTCFGQQDVHRCDWRLEMCSCDCACKDRLALLLLCHRSKIISWLARWFQRRLRERDTHGSELSQLQRPEAESLQSTHRCVSNNKRLLFQATEFWHGLFRSFAVAIANQYRRELVIEGSLYLPANKIPNKNKLYLL